MKNTNSKNNNLTIEQSMDKMMKKIDRLPQLHADVVYAKHFTRKGKVESDEHVADMISLDYGFRVNEDQIRDIYKDALGMLRFHEPEGVEAEQRFSVRMYCDDISESMEYGPKGKTPLVGCSSRAKDEKGKTVNVCLIAKNEKGAEKLEQMKNTGKLRDLAYILADRSDYWVGTGLWWEATDVYTGNIHNNENLRENLKKAFGDMDFVYLPQLEDLYNVDGGVAFFGDESMEMTDWRLCKMKETMIPIVSELEELGIRVLPYLYLEREDMYTAIMQYYYLGKDVAKKIVVDNMNALAGEVQHLAA